MSDLDGYAGDLDPKAAFELLSTDPHAVLVDVRSRAEWTFVGVPDLQGIGKQGVFLEWQSFPGMQVDPLFIERLNAALADQAAPEMAPLLFLCRSGARSKAAAIAMTTAGRFNCFNISDGFEGPRDEAGHRGRTAGWKALALPWSQS